MTTYRLKLLRICLLGSIFLLANSLRAELPEWIWYNNHPAKTNDNEVRFFRKPFTVDGKVNKARLSIAADDYAEVFLNGRKIGAVNGWKTAAYFDVTKDLKSGDNLLALRGTNMVAAAAILAMLEMDFPKGHKEFINTDKSWLSSATGPDGWNKLKFDAAGWTPVVTLGKLGVEPWGNVLDLPVATSTAKFKLLPGFKAELLHSAEPGEGTWVCMAIDPRGRLIVSPQEGTNNLLRITLSSKGQVEENRENRSARRLRHGPALRF